MSRWTRAQVEQQAPDPKALAAARRLALPGPWSDTGSTDTLVWGRCQGSGAAPYQVSVDLTGPAFTCSCPSRKFPCKHGLALLLLWADGGGSVAAAAAPAGLTQRQQEREQRLARQSGQVGPGAGDAGAGEGGGPSDPEAQARRRARRIELMTAGLDDFDQWLRDLAAQGLAAARQRPYAWWDATAARLVDAQLPGLADRIRMAAGDIHRRPDWVDHLLAEVGRWFLAVEAWRRRSTLDTDSDADLRVYLGWPPPAEPPLGPARRWHVLGVHRSDDGRLQSQRTWLLDPGGGETVLSLDFAAAGAALRVPQVVGAVIEAAPAFPPGHGPRRAILPEELRPVADRPALGPPRSVAGALDELGARLGANPFLDRIPVTLGPVRIDPAEDGDGGDDGEVPGWVVDGAGAALPLAAGSDPWALLARTGGHPSTLFGEIDDHRFRPLTLALDGAVVGL